MLGIVFIGHTQIALKASWSHVLLVGFVGSIVADFCLAIVTALLAERLYHVFRSARSYKLLHEKG